MFFFKYIKRNWRRFSSFWSLAALSNRGSLMDNDGLTPESQKARCRWHYWKETSLEWMIWPRGSICSLNSRGSWMEPWGTPQDMETLRLMITNRNNIIRSFKMWSDFIIDCTFSLPPPFWPVKKDLFIYGIISWTQSKKHHIRCFC